MSPTTISFRSLNKALGPSKATAQGGSSGQRGSLPGQQQQQQGRGYAQGPSNGSGSGSRRPQSAAAALQSSPRQHLVSPRGGPRPELWSPRRINTPPQPPAGSARKAKGWVVTGRATTATNSWEAKLEAVPPQPQAQYVSPYGRPHTAGQTRLNGSGGYSSDFGGAAALLSPRWGSGGGSSVSPGRNRPAGRSGGSPPPRQRYGWAI